MAQPASAARLPQPVQTILGGLPFSGPHRMILMVIQVLLFVLLGCVRATGARRGSGEAEVLLQGRIVPCGGLQTSSFYDMILAGSSRSMISSSSMKSCSTRSGEKGERCSGRWRAAWSRDGCGRIATGGRVFSLGCTGRPGPVTHLRATTLEVPVPSTMEMTWRATAAMINVSSFA